MNIEKQRYVVARLRPINGVQNTKVVMSGLSRSIAEVIAAVDLADYRYFWFETVDMTIERGDGIYTVRTHVWNQSSKYFINAYVEEYADVLVNNAELAKQMTNLGWTHIARNIGTKGYWTEHFNPDEDQLVTLDGEITGV